MHIDRDCSWHRTAPSNDPTGEDYRQIDQALLELDFVKDSESLNLIYSNKVVVLEWKWLDDIPAEHIESEMIQASLQASVELFDNDLLKHDNMFSTILI